MNKKLFALPMGVLLFGAFLHEATSAAPPELELVWETTGLDNPESVVYSASLDALLVSNVNGGAVDKDENGYIAKVSLDGKVIEKHWVKGLDAPKGMALRGDTLYVADIDTLAVIDVPSAKIKAWHRAQDARFLNDVAVNDKGEVFVSDMVRNRIHRLAEGRFTVWLESPDLENPNGLLVEGNALVLGAWGVMKADFSTEVPGHLKYISLKDKSIVSMGGAPIGNLDGVEPAFTERHYYVTDWVGGKLFRISAEGKAEVLLELTKGTADIAVLPKRRWILLPMMLDNKLLAYKVK